MPADTTMPPNPGGGNPVPLPIQARATIPVEDDGAFVILRVALYLEADAGIDLALMVIGATARVKGVRP